MTIKDFAAWLIRIVCGVRSLPVEAVHTGRVVYFANHSSHLDFTTIWAALPSDVRCRARPVAGRDYWCKTSLRRSIAEGFFRAVLIERRHITASCDPLGSMTAALEAGDSLIVFPEGTRSTDGNVNEFKPGLYHIARAMSDVPLVPIYLQDLNRILPKGDVLPVPLLGSLHLGEAIRLLPGEGKQEFLQRARQAVLSLSHL